MSQAEQREASSYGIYIFFFLVVSSRAFCSGEADLITSPLHRLGAKSDEARDGALLPLAQHLQATAKHLI